MNSALAASILETKQCVPCEGGVAKYSLAEATAQVAALPAWRLKHAGWSEWVVMGSFPMFAVVGIHEFSLARMDPFAVVAGEVGFWKSFLCFVIEKEFQFQEFF